MDTILRQMTLMGWRIVKPKLIIIKTNGVKTAGWTVQPLIKLLYDQCYLGLQDVHVQIFRINMVYCKATLIKVFTLSIQTYIVTQIRW